MNTTQNDVHWVSTPLAAQIIGTSRQWIWMLARRYGQIRYVRLGKNAIAVCLEDVVRWKQENPKPKRTPRYSKPTTFRDIETLFVPERPLASV